MRKYISLLTIIALSVTYIPETLAETVSAPSTSGTNILIQNQQTGTITGSTSSLPGMEAGSPLSSGTESNTVETAPSTETSPVETTNPETEISSQIEEKIKSLTETAKSATFTGEASPIEAGFYTRTKTLGIKLKQFGYNFFVGKKLPALNIPVDKTYVLGPGDELFLYVIGNPPNIDISQITKLVVDREGKIYIPGFGVFYVWGKTLGEAESLISKALGVNIKLTVGRLRTFPVYVSGEVRNPGAVIATGANTVIDAIIMAGGVKGTGSLRNIIVRRTTPNGVKTIHIDFYRLLLKGEPINMRLKDGDVIFIPPIKKVAGIGGGVRRPAIYELKGNETLKDLIKMAGGVLPSAYKYKVVIQRYKNNEFLEVIEGSLSDKKFISQPLHSGDLVVIKKVISVPQNAVMVDGYTAYPGLYEYKPGMKLSDILKPDMFLLDTNMKFGLILRQYPPGTPPEYITFAPEDIVNGNKDIPLMPSDTVYLYRFGTTKKVDFDKVKDAFVVEGEIKYPGVYAYRKGMKLSELLTPDMISINTNLHYAEIDRRDPETLDIKEIKEFAPIDILNHKTDIEIKPLDVIKFYPKFVFSPIKVSGAVKNPHFIPYHRGMKLSDALSGIEFTKDIKKLKADIYRELSRNAKSASALEKAQNIKVQAESGAETIKSNITSVYLYNLLMKHDTDANITLNPGDRIVIREIAPDEIVEKVSVSGYVRNPGTFKITSKTTLYDVLKAAGGFRENAYPRGIIILRNSVRTMEKERLSKAILQMRQELEKEQAGIMQADLSQQELAARQSAFESKRKLLELMEKTQVSGRITGIVIPEDLEKLKNSPYNILLEDGDQIIVPKKPSSVLVFGEVYNPGAIVYQKGMTVKDYLKLCGGLTKDADRENIFVIKADGTTLSSDRKFSFITWNTRERRFLWGTPEEEILNYELQPGDAVIVPTKIHVPTMWRPLIRDVIQIIYQSALTVYTITHI
ncbi:SLBB domain-containing protein [Desulfurobacterium sp. TC5-1]|uniref:SLBB domain-containing protein n=1 Tax=Desulfurobacterium sp. TC5-1 TaxID=1158318 RepID=UPI0003B60C28|nr:SLBB domain-containing protein [Desulfurobacterium sp. TC5-1]